MVGAGWERSHRKAEGIWMSSKRIGLIGRLWASDTNLGRAELKTFARFDKHKNRMRYCEGKRSRFIQSLIKCNDTLSRWAYIVWRCLICSCKAGKAGYIWGRALKVRSTVCVLQCAFTHASAACLCNFYLQLLTTQYGFDYTTHKNAFQCIIIGGLV